MVVVSVWITPLRTALMHPPQENIWVTVVLEAGTPTMVIVVIIETPIATPIVTVTLDDVEETAKRTAIFMEGTTAIGVTAEAPLLPEVDATLLSTGVGEVIPGARLLEEAALHHVGNGITIPLRPLRLPLPIPLAGKCFYSPIQYPFFFLFLYFFIVLWPDECLQDHRCFMVKRRRKVKIIGSSDEALHNFPFIPIVVYKIPCLSCREERTSLRLDVGRYSIVKFSSCQVPLVISFSLPLFPSTEDISANSLLVKQLSMVKWQASTIAPSVVALCLCCPSTGFVGIDRPLGTCWKRSARTASFLRHCGLSWPTHL